MTADKFSGGTSLFPVDTLISSQGSLSGAQAGDLKLQGGFTSGSYGDIRIGDSYTANISLEAPITGSISHASNLVLNAPSGTATIIASGTAKIDTDADLILDSAIGDISVKQNGLTYTPSAASHVTTKAYTDMVAPSTIINTRIVFRPGATDR